MLKSKTYPIQEEINLLQNKLKSIQEEESKEVRTLKITAEVKSQGIFNRNIVKTYFIGLDFVGYREAPLSSHSVDIKLCDNGRDYYGSYCSRPHCVLWKRPSGLIKEHLLVLVDKNTYQIIYELGELEPTKYTLNFNPYFFDYDDAMFIAHKYIEAKLK